MSRLTRIGWWRGSMGLVVLTILTLAVVRYAQPKEPEIALVIGEPWEEMRKRSSSAIDQAIPNEIWHNIPKSDARLRFIDPQYGFVTPPARYFTISYIRGVVNDVRMSPQIEPLLLDDALKIVLDLQEQWRKGGWVPVNAKEDPPFADTPQWRAQLRDVHQASTTYWQAGDRYQVMLLLALFDDVRHPHEERYLITLALAKPWVKP